MITVSRTFTVAAEPAAVIDYLKDFSHAVEWDPGTQSCTRNDDGPIQVGASWHNVSKILGLKTELTYTLERLEPDTIVLVGRNDTATSTDTITVRAAASGSELTYQAELEMHGVAKLTTPVMKLEFEKLANETEKQLGRGAVAPLSARLPYKERMRIAALVTQPRGGPVDHAVDVACELAARGHDSHLIGPLRAQARATRRRGRHLARRRGRVQGRPARRTRSCDGCCANCDADVLHCQDMRAGMVGRHRRVRHRAVDRLHRPRRADGLSDLVPGQRAGRAAPTLRPGALPHRRTLARPV